MERRNSCVASSAGCCTGRDEKCPQKLLKGLGQSMQQPVLGASHTAVPYRGNSSRDISYCETLMFPSGKSNVSLGFPQDGYFPSGLWEVAAPLLPAQDCEQRCHAALQHRIKQEQSLAKRNVCSWQWDAASPSPCLGSEKVAVWCCVWGTGCCEEPVLSPCSNSISCGLRYGWEAPQSCQLLPITVSYSWGLGGLSSPKNTRASSTARRAERSPGNYSP